MLLDLWQGTCKHMYVGWGKAREVLTHTVTSNCQEDTLGYQVKDLQAFSSNACLRAGSQTIHKCQTNIEHLPFPLPPLPPVCQPSATTAHDKLSQPFPFYVCILVVRTHALQTYFSLFSFPKPSVVHWKPVLANVG